jgi:hypothetical protein
LGPANWPRPSESGKCPAFLPGVVSSFVLTGR